MEKSLEVILSSLDKHARILGLIAVAVDGFEASSVLRNEEFCNDDLLQLVESLMKIEIGIRHSFIFTLLRRYNEFDE
ncbi:MAG: hypothetical protein NZO16_06085 [Deltaproteobacteria bacterium]|nr:hypothetical protein [Deltaproteobacteria bacterium]